MRPTDAGKAELPPATTGKKRRILILVPWLALLLVVLCYVILWSRLPAELAVKFDWSGAPGDTLNKTTSLLLDCAVLFFVLGRFTLKLWDRPDSDRDTRALFITYYLAVLFITTVFLVILKFNL
ncbi:MAG TPA: hypothetical protein VF656_08700 [Pyrinomonadaceae bacterium]|jgi:hypothetical protein